MGSESPVAGQLMGDYRLLDEIGAGGFSLVWRARHVSTGAIVALKLPRVDAFVEQLRREALIASRFQDPQLVGIHEVHLDHHPPFLVMPYVPGSDLDLPDQPPAPEQIVSAFRRFRQVVDVVARLHKGGIVHGDLKPGNIRFDPEGTCHLLDLGLARQQVRTRQTTTLRASIVSVDGKSIAGTLEYMAPEVMAGEKPDERADVFALGVILHTLLCGRPPAFGVSPKELNPFLPPGTSDFLRQLIHPDPSRRLSDASWLLPGVDGFIRAEERCLRRRNGHARRRVFRRRMRTLARGIRVLGLTGALILFLMIGLPFFLKVLPRALMAGVGPPLLILIGGYLGVIGMLLGITTINAWILGVPEKVYKNRSGHPLWTFMMQ